MPKKYPEELKKQIIVSYRDGTTIQELCRKHDVAQSTLYRWLREADTDAEGHTLADYKTLEKENARLSHLLQIVRLSGVIQSVPRQKRLEIMAGLYSKFDQYSISELCEAMEIAKGTFYNHIFRKADRAGYIQEQQELRLLVQQIFDDSRQVYGAEKIRVTLAENGVKVGKKRIRAIMQELGLVSIRENAKKNYKRRQEALKQNFVKQNFAVKRMNEVWVSDITYFKIRDYAVYLCVIIDLFSRRVVGYRVSRKSSTHLVTATFKEAFAARGAPAYLTFHSDRGGQYISDTFQMLLHQNGVTQSFSNTGRAYDNAVAETFFANFKREEAYRRDYSSEADFRKSVDEYIRFYNEVRPHKTLAYKSPARFEELYGAKKL